MLDDFVADEAVDHVPDAPNVWTDGSLVLDEVSGASSSGSGFLNIFLVFIAPPVGGDIWMTLGMMAGAALFLGFRLFRGLSSGASFLLCRLLRLCTLVLIPSMWFGMLVDWWMGIGVRVLLNF